MWKEIYDFIYADPNAFAFSIAILIVIPWEMIKLSRESKRRELEHQEKMKQLEEQSRIRNLKYQENIKRIEKIKSESEEQWKIISWSRVSYKRDRGAN